MPDPVEFSCRIRIEPGNAHSYSKIKISVGSEVLVDDYEGSLPADVRAVLPRLLAAHAKSVGSLLRR